MPGLAVTPESKIDMVNRLGELNGWSRYLELCTPTTGGYYATVDRARFKTCHRLMYRRPEDFEDGLPVDFHSADIDISECTRRIAAKGLRYDVMLADSWHEYDTSYRDLAAAYELLEVGGVMIVHDCLPPTEEIASPTLRAGAWCGVTYKAYLDFVTAHPALAYYTVDTDYGCGVIRRLRPEGLVSRSLASLQGAVRRLRSQSRPHAGDEYPAIVQEWKKLGKDYAATFRFFQRHHRSLLRLKTFREFLEIERAMAAATRPGARPGRGLNEIARDMLQ
jgi:hypothetical protein